MSLLRIEGPCCLKGTMRPSGAKNAALPMIAACLLTDEPVVLHNVPLGLADVTAMLELIAAIGVDVTADPAGSSVRLQARNVNPDGVPDELANRVRTSLLLLGTLLARSGRVVLAKPGGCQIGDRRHDLHVMGMRSLGATVEQTGEHLKARAERLTAADIDFYLPSTTATENVMMAAVLARGRSSIRNANTRPEVANLAEMLCRMGATVHLKPRLVEIEGVEKLHGTECTVQAGADEAVTYLIAGAVTGGEIMIDGLNADSVRWDLQYLRQSGCDVFEWGGNLYLSAKQPLRPFDLFTGPFPAVNSDMQPIFAVLATQAHGQSTITDQRFTERFQYAEQLHLLGADIEVLGNTAIISGPSRLKGARTWATDLRGGAALVVAALAADGVTEIANVRQIDRGYERLVEKLSALGGHVERTG